jgi:putative hydrolase of the HAD superfamily
LDFVHDIDLSRLTPDPELPGLLARLPGRRFVFTNGDAPYARRVLEAIGVHDRFDDVHDLRANSFRPKPDIHGYELLCERFGIDPKHALMVDDMARNLKPAKLLGMTTVWVDNGSERGNDGVEDSFIDHRITDVGDWLETILRDDR